MNTSPQPLDYRPPATPAQVQLRRLVFRWCILGPIPGAFIGLIDVGSAMCNWIYFGQPDFYFRGWQGVKVHSALMAVCGAIAGVLFGTAIIMFENFCGRCVRIVPQLIFMFLLAVAVFGILSHFEIRYRWILPEGLIFAPETAVVLLSALGAMLLSRPIKMRG